MMTNTMIVTRAVIDQNGIITVVIIMTVAHRTIAEAAVADMQAGKLECSGEESAE